MANHSRGKMARKGKLVRATCAPVSERGNDLYETPPVAVHALLRVEALPRSAVIWEPACGPGSIVTVLRGAQPTLVTARVMRTGDGIPVEIEAEVK